MNTRSGKEANNQETEDPKQTANPKQAANCWSLLTFWWIGAILKKGNKTSLSDHDLFPLLDEDKSKELVEGLEQGWLQEMASCHSEGTKPRLWKCLLRMVPLKDLIFVAVLKLAQSATTVMLPIMLWFFLGSLVSWSTLHHQSAFGWVTGLCLIALASALSGAHWTYTSDMWGIRLKTASIGLVYKKIIKLKRCDLEKVLSGNTLNLVANDARRLERAGAYLGYFLAAPFEILVSLFLLWHLIGWQALIGACFMVLVVLYASVMSGVSAKLRKKAATSTDQRLAVMNEIISGIRAVKTYAWEENYCSLVKGLRSKEISLTRLRGVISSSFIALFHTTTDLSGFISITLLLMGSTELTAFTTFTFLSLLNVMKISVCMGLGECLLNLADIKVGLNRMETFCYESQLQALKPQQKAKRCTDILACIKNIIACSAPHKSKTYTTHSPFLITGSLENGQPILKDWTRLPSCHISTEKEFHVSLDNISCSWSDDTGRETLTNVSLTIKAGQLVVVTGPVGSGKSSLLMAILGELPISSGRVSAIPSVAYVSQIPWVFSGTVRENITFGRPYSQQKYRKVLEACGLIKDINSFAKSDLTRIGERGVSLSGGQRARVSLARAVYAEADIYLLDDPLSAVDAKVGKHVFESCICGMLAGRVRVLSTHQLQYANKADQVVVLRDGEVVQEGSNTQVKRDDLTPETLTQNARVQEGDKLKRGLSVRPSMHRVGKSFKDLEEEAEDREVGSLGWRAYWDFFRAGAPAPVLVCLLLLIIFVQVSLLSPYWWLSRMIDMSHDQQRSSSTLAIYGVLVFGSLFVSTLGAFSIFYATLRSSEKLHNRMTAAVIKAPVLFFDTNPAGRILNRFSKDIGCMDDSLPGSFLSAVQLLMFSLFAFLIPVATNLWLFIALVPLIALILFVTRYYLKSSRELKRLEAVKCSPVYSHISETVHGLEIIRSSKMEGDFLTRLYRNQDENTRASFVIHSCSRWFAVRLDFLCSIFVTVVSVGAALISQNPATAGLSLTYAIQTVNLMQYAVKKVSEVENFMTSAERVMTYTNLDPEPGYNASEEAVESWPQEGALEIKNMSLFYIKDGPRVLKDISFSVKAKEKVGIAGRTGAGKSSMVAALFRMPDPQGKILIDGIDVGTLNVKSARRAMAVITQDPILFSGSLRKNLDPFSQSTDADLWAALEEVQLKPLVQKLQGQLHFVLRESGSNFSVGERQLLCLARALLQKSKIIIMDEATANVDFKTDRLIQEVIRHKFRDCTVLTIAHRLNTIVDYDKVLVLDGGKVVEFDKPEVLLQKEHGCFTQLMRADHQSAGNGETSPDSSD